MTDDLVKRLRCARGVDAALDDEAADRIEALEAEVGRMREALALAQPWVSPPLDDRDMSASAQAHRAIAAALKLKEKRDA